MHTLTCDSMRPGYLIWVGFPEGQQSLQRNLTSPNLENHADGTRNFFTQADGCRMSLPCICHALSCAAGVADLIQGMTSVAAGLELSSTLQMSGWMCSVLDAGET